MKPTLIKSILKKFPYILLFYMAAGIFCRWYQLKYELNLQGDGSLVEGAFMHTVLLLMTITFMVGLAVLIFKLENISDRKDCFFKDPRTLSLQIGSGGLLVFGCVLQLFVGTEPISEYSAVAAAMTQYLPYLGILAGICIALFAVLISRDASTTPILYMLASLYLVVRLIVFFQEWNMDPSAHDYAYQLLAAITTMLGCFQIAGFCFGKGKRRITIFWCLCATFFCAVSIPDSQNNLADLLINIAMLILTATQGFQLLYAPQPTKNAEGSSET